MISQDIKTVVTAFDWLTANLETVDYSEYDVAMTISHRKKAGHSTTQKSHLIYIRLSVVDIQISSDNLDEKRLYAEKRKIRTS